MKMRILATLTFVLSAAVPIAAQDGNQLAAARDLYASARYDEALAVLNGLGSGLDAPERKSIEQYRSLCLLALGRGAEAEAAIAAVVTVDPLFQPSESDASPRVRAAFTEVRQRLLPDIVARRYAFAKATYDRKEYARAQEEFTGVIKLLNDPQMAGKLEDLRVLAGGFLELSTVAATPPPPPKPEPVPEVAPPPPPKPVKSVYAAEDEDVTPPGIIRQEFPPVPAAITTQVRNRGLLEIVIDEQGRVTGITLRQPMHPVYDQALVSAARDWRYRPATFQGKPVKFKKIIAVAVDKRR